MSRSVNLTSPESYEDTKANIALHSDNVAALCRSIYGNRSLGNLSSGNRYSPSIVAFCTPAGPVLVEGSARECAGPDFVKMMFKATKSGTEFHKGAVVCNIAGSETVWIGVLESGINTPTLPPTCNEQFFESPVAVALQHSFWVASDALAETFDFLQLGKEKDYVPLEWKKVKLIQKALAIIGRSLRQQVPGEALPVRAPDALVWKAISDSGLCADLSGLPVKLPFTMFSRLCGEGFHSDGISINLTAGDVRFLLGQPNFNDGSDWRGLAGISFDVEHGRQAFWPVDVKYLVPGHDDESEIPTEFHEWYKNLIAQISLGAKHGWRLGLAVDFLSSIIIPCSISHSFAKLLPETRRNCGDFGAGLPMQTSGLFFNLETCAGVYKTWETLNERR